jgi:hypothetical protein
MDFFIRNAEIEDADSGTICSQISLLNIYLCFKLSKIVLYS